MQVRREERDSTGFGKETIYRFDEALFDKLRSAFERKDHRALVRFWNRAEKYR
jgi:hypothetical protein